MMGIRLGLTGAFEQDLSSASIRTFVSLKTDGERLAVAVAVRAVRNLIMPK